MDVNGKSEKDQRQRVEEAIFYNARTRRPQDGRQQILVRYNNVAIKAYCRACGASPRQVFLTIGRRLRPGLDSEALIKRIREILDSISSHSHGSSNNGNGHKKI